MIHFCSSLCLNSPHKWAYSPECRNYEDTDTYFQFACMLFESIYRYHPDSPVVLLGYNLTEKQEEKLKEICPSLKIISAPLEASSQPEYKGLVELRRIQFIRQLLESESIGNEDILAYLDIDCLLRSPLKIQEFMFSSRIDMGIMKRNAKQYDKHINMGVVFMRNTQQTKRFIKSWYNGLPEADKVSPMKSNSRTYVGPQALFYELSQQKAYRDVNFWWLPSQFNDRHLQSDSIIWHGNKGNKLDRLNDFKKEMKR